MPKVVAAGKPILYCAQRNRLWSSGSVRVGKEDWPASGYDKKYPIRHPEQVRFQVTVFAKNLNWVNFDVCVMGVDTNYGCRFSMTQQPWECLRLHCIARRFNILFIDQLPINLIGSFVNRTKPNEQDKQTECYRLAAGDSDKNIHLSLSTLIVADNCMH